MKFSDIEPERWDELKPYVDTVLLPLSGLTGRETPWQATAALERLRDALDPIETAYRGRVVTYPALHYAENESALARIADELCERFYDGGFRYCVAVTGDPALLTLPLAKASALVGPEPRDGSTPMETYASFVRRTIETLWASGRAGATRSEL